MPLELTKKQLFETIQVLYPGLGPNKDYKKFKEAAFEAFYLQLGIQKENVVDPVAVEKIFTFVEIFVKNFKRLWNLRNNKCHFLNMLRNNPVFFEKVWSFEDVLNPPPPPVIPVVELVDLDETGDAHGSYYIYLCRLKYVILHTTIVTQMPCPSSGPKMFCSGPNLLYQTKR